MTERRHVQMSAVKTLIPGQGQRPHPTAKTNTQIIRRVAAHRKQLKQSRRRAPHGIRRAAAKNAGFPLFNTVQHMRVGLIGNPGTGAAGNAPGRRQKSAPPAERQIKIRPFPPAVTCDRSPRPVDRFIVLRGQPAAESARHPAR